MGEALKERNDNGNKQTPDTNGQLLVWLRCRDINQALLLARPRQDTAESAVIAVEYGGVLGFLVLHGYGPSRKNDTGEAASGLRQTHPRRRWPVSPRNGASRRPRLSD